jgi:putative ABC transport system substrate-binding protein
MFISRRQFGRFSCGVAFGFLTVIAKGRGLPAFAADAAMPRIAVVDPFGSTTFGEGFRSGLRRTGYSEGKNIAVEWRRSAETDEELQALVSDLGRSGIDLMVTIGSPATRAALQRTALPVVFLVGDPVATGFAASLAKPGGKGTGVSVVSPELGVKRLELLQKLVPKARRIGHLVDPTNPLEIRMRPGIQAAARTLGVQLESMDAANPLQLESVLRALQKNPPDALLVSPVAFFLAHGAAITEAARKSRIPAMYPYREFLAVGGLMSYGPDQYRIGDLMAGYVDRILRGAKPGDLAIEQMSKYDLVVDMRVARKMGIRVPQDLLLLADEVIK